MTDDAAPRRHWWPQSVRVRLTVVATLAFAIALSAAAFGLVKLVRTNLVDRIQETNQHQLDDLASQVRRGDLNPEPGYQCVYVNGIPQGCRPTPPDRSGYEAAQREVDTQAGRITLVAQNSLDEVDRTVNSVTDVLLIAVPAMIALVGLAAWYFTGRALRPVEAIRQQAESITGTTMDRRVPEPDTDDEVGRLARTMNAMLDRLETSSRKQRQFVSDAAHELRSPLASIRTNLEVALRNADRTDWSAVAGRALAEDVRMEDMVSELLELARVDEAAGPTPLASLPEVDLDELVLDDTVQQRRGPVGTPRGSARRGGWRVDTARGSGGGVPGGREQLTRVVHTPLDNAARHAAHAVAVE